MERTISKHYNSKRNRREKLIEKYIHDGNVIDKFYVDRGHPDGAEIHCVTDTGLIIIYNAVTNRLVTKLIARPHQILRYYVDTGKSPPQELIDLAYKHYRKGYYRR